MSNRSLQVSFGGGEVSPEMFGRIDDAKYRTGLALCENFNVKPQGPVENRAGFAFVRETKISSRKSRVIPFTYSNTQTMILEFGHEYIRFHTLGATLLLDGQPYEVSTPYDEDDLFDLHYVQSADVLTIVHPSYAPRELRRLSATLWELGTITVASQITAPTGVAAVCTGCTDNKYTYAYVVTALAADGVSESEASSEATVEGNLYETGCIVTISWSAVDGASRYYVYKKQGGIYGYIGNSTTLSIVDDDIDIDLSRTPPIYDDIFSIAGGISAVEITNGGTDYNTVVRSVTDVDVLNGGRYESITGVSVSDSTGAGAVLTFTTESHTHLMYYSGRYSTRTYLSVKTVSVTSGGEDYINPSIVVSGVVSPWQSVTWDETAGYLYESLSSNVASFGITRSPSSATLSVTDTGGGSGAVLTPTVTAGVITAITVTNPGSGYVNPTVAVSFGGGGNGATFGTVTLTSTGDYPGAVSYFEQRRCFAGTTKKPQNMWMTRSGTESNMSYSLPIRDDDRISFRVAAREANQIRHIVPLSQLLLLTAAAEWRVTSVNSDAITPSSIDIRPQSYIGASNVQPVIVNTNLLYAANRGGHVRECAYNWQAGGFITGDLSIRAAHLFDSYEIVDMAFGKAPFPLVCGVSNSGYLLDLTYVPEQQIGAWSRHSTVNGTFESCAIVSEGAEDVLYVVVNRLVNGANVRYIERQASRAFVDQKDAFFVDSGLTYDGTNTDTTISVTLSGGTTWGPGDLLTITASSALFDYPATTDIGDAIVVTDQSGVKYTITLYGVTSTTVATGRTDRTIPAELQDEVTPSWSFARSTITGLDHLEGETVNILADGAVHPRRVVSSGAVVLDFPASVVQAGLPITANIYTLPFAIQVDNAFGQGRAKNINRAWMRVYRSSGIWVGPDEDHLVEAKQRTTELYGSPPALKSEELELVLSPSWTDNGSAYIRQEDPLPLTIVSLTLDVTLGG